MPEGQAQTGAQKIIGDFAPKLVSLTDDVLVGDIWKRPELAPRNRSLITVASLITGGSTEQRHLVGAQHRLHRQARRCAPRRPSAGHASNSRSPAGTFPRFDRNSHTGRSLATETADHYRPLINRVLHDAAHPSSLILPIIER